MLGFLRICRWRLDPLRLQERFGTHKLQFKFVSFTHSACEIALQNGDLRCVSSLSLRQLL